jgi:nucleotide-binding universal stress UspA family protein
VIVLTADEDDGKTTTRVQSAERVAAQFRRHGSTSEARLVVPGGRTLHDSILETAAASGLSTLVMVAGHSRLRELVSVASPAVLD